MISEADLKMRGAGELLGKRQAGDMGYYVADIVRDEAILIDAKNRQAPTKHQQTQSL